MEVLPLFLVVKWRPFTFLQSVDVFSSPNVSLKTPKSARREFYFSIFEIHPFFKALGKGPKNIFDYSILDYEIRAVFNLIISSQRTSGQGTPWRNQGREKSKSGHVQNKIVVTTQSMAQQRGDTIMIRALVLFTCAAIASGFSPHAPSLGLRPGAIRTRILSGSIPKQSRVLPATPPCPILLTTLTPLSVPALQPPSPSLPFCIFSSRSPPSLRH